MTWDEGYAEYVETSYEVRLHRRLNTFGAVLWPPNPQERFLEIALDVLDRASANAQ